MKKNLRKILILHTGGTFGMALTANKPAKTRPASFLKEVTKKIPELKSLAHIKLDILCNQDSSDINSRLWTTLAEKIHANWNKFDGFVVIHGTDTLSWTACALAFFLEKLTKPVVLTGSQRPISALRNDGRANIIDAVELAAKGLPEVMVCFDSQVHRATRVTKYSNEHLLAFKSFNAPLLGRFGVSFKTSQKNLDSVVNETKRHVPLLNLKLNTNIMMIPCLPSVKLTASFIETLLANYDGLILQGFGSGNLPLQEKSWYQLCEKAFAKKIPVVMTSHCKSGAVNLSLYKNGKKFLNVRVLSSLDMTIEAASIKLMVLLGQKIPFERQREFFETPFVHECFVDNVEQEKDER